MHRELGRLRQERTAHRNRIRSLLVLHNLRVERLSLVARQIGTLEALQEQQVRSGVQPAIAVLARLAGIGTGSAWTLVKVLFGFHNLRDVAGCLGLAPTPYSSGTSEVD